MRLRAIHVIACCVVVATGCGDGTSSDTRTNGMSGVSQVLLISVDGLHSVDLTNWIAKNPNSALGQLSAHGTVFTAAKTTTPSDSFPGLLALVTGGTPKTTGVYYDDSYDRTLFAPSSDCTGNPGIEAVFDESVEMDSSQLFSPLNPANLPRQRDAAGNCTPVFPHTFLKVNTVFEVAKGAGKRTAWSDKHPAYDLVNGPSGNGVDDLYTPEVNSLIKNGGVANGVDLASTLALCDGTNSLPSGKVTDYTTCLPAVEAYDDVKVQAIINEINGMRSDGSAGEGVPDLFGMNFQTISVTQKLPVGGYTDASGTPTANLSAALTHTDASLGRIVAALQSRDLLSSTLIIITAKHGQSPIDRSKLAMESGGSGNTSVQDPSGFIAKADPTVDSPSSFTNPNSGATLSTSGHLQTDDVGLVWLQNQSSTNVAAVTTQLQDNAAAIVATTLPPATILPQNITAGAALAKIYGDPTSNDAVASARAPNVIIQPNAGVIYSGSSKKIAEHGGGTLDDTNVALVVALPTLRAQRIATPVSTTQVAPTMLRALGLDPKKLQAVRAEGTEELPDLF
jgi:hypothetical protein